LDPDKCGLEVQGEIVSDACAGSNDTDNCMSLDANGNRISDTCSPNAGPSKHDPDKCDPRVSEPDDCLPPFDVDVCITMEPPDPDECVPDSIDYDYCVPSQPDDEVICGQRMKLPGQLGGVPAPDAEPPEH
jgi:hypothetical protein